MYWNFNNILVGTQAPRFAAGERPVIVEVGFGNGEYLEYLARAHANALIVGIEVSQWCLTKAARRALAVGLDNIRLLHGDARYLLRYAFEPGSIAAVYMNFPCPWPKRRHAERRVTSPQFAGLLRNSLAPGGTFTLATDVDWYAAATREAFTADAAFATGPVIRNPERPYFTKYERKWREMGRDTYLVEAHRAAAAGEYSAREALAEDENIKGEEICMASWNSAEASAFRDRIRSVKGDTLDEKGYKVMFREVFFAEDDTALITVIAVDEGFEQHYHLRLIPAGCEIRGKVDAVGHPYRTPGVRASLKHLMRRIGAKF